MCCPTVSASFVTFSLITLVSIFNLKLLNMIFSIVTPKEYKIFDVKYLNTYKSSISLSMLDDLKKIKYSNEKTLEEIRVLQEKYRDLTEIYTNGELEELNDRVKRFKTILMAFGISSFSVLGGFIMIFVPIYSTTNCGANCSEDCDCNCDCWLCLGVNPIKRIILFYLVCLPIVLFSFVSFFLTLAKKSTYNDISSMKDIKQYQRTTTYFGEVEKDYDDSVSYNEAQFIDYLIILLVLVLYPLVVWLTSSKEEMNPPIRYYQKKVRTINTKTNMSTELSVGSDCSYNSHPTQPPPQPQYHPPPPQPHYHPPPPHPHHHLPSLRPIVPNIRGLIPSDIVINIH